MLDVWNLNGTLIKRSPIFRNMESPLLKQKTVFGDPLSMTYSDPNHSIDENRFITIGLSSSGKLLILAHTDRGDRIRIISVRVATQQRTEVL